jgi:hypothetical protein
VTWTVRVRDIRRRAGGLRWTLVASTPDLETLVWADSTLAGAVFDLQSDEYVGTTGDLELDDLARETIRATLAARGAAQQLDAIDRQRWGRIQQPADRRRAA